MKETNIVIFIVPFNCVMTISLLGEYIEVKMKLMLLHNRPLSTKWSDVHSNIFLSRRFQYLTSAVSFFASARAFKTTF